MPPRSNVITMLPAWIRQEIDGRLFANGFRDYEGLAQWVRAQSYEISNDSLWRYGYDLQRQFAAARLTILQARAWAELSAGHEGSMAQALITIAQQKALSTLLETEQVRPADLNAIANLIRGGLAQQRRTAELNPPRDTHSSPGTKDTSSPAQPGQLDRSSPEAPQPASRTTATPPHQTRPVSNPVAESGSPVASQEATVNIPVEERLLVARDKAIALLQPASHRASPRIPANSSEPAPAKAICSRSSFVSDGAFPNPETAIQSAPHQASPRLTALISGSPPFSTPSSSAYLPDRIWSPAEG
jgi:hypothetical protein